MRAYSLHDMVSPLPFGDYGQLPEGTEAPVGLAQACLRLAAMLNTLVAVVRLPSAEQPLPDSPDILACHFGDSETSSTVLETTDMYLSKSVLEAIRAGDAPVMAGSGASSDTDMMLTVIDTQKPHLVFAARVRSDHVHVIAVDPESENNGLQT